MTIVKIKNLKGRITGYRARRGRVVADGENAKHAAANLEIAVDKALDDLTIGTHIIRWQGHILVIAPTIWNSWSYWIDDFSDSQYNCSGFATMEESRVNAFHHLAQNLWSLEMIDDIGFCAAIPINEQKQKEILSWIKWQRSYAANKAAGMSDTEAHKATCIAA